MGDARARSRSRRRAATAPRSTSRPTSPAEAFERLLAYVEETGRTFVHPFDDPVARRPGTERSGSRSSRTCPTSTTIVVPVGGGGLDRRASRVGRRTAASSASSPRRSALLRRARGRRARARSSRSSIADGLERAVRGRAARSAVCRERVDRGRARHRRRDRGGDALPLRAREARLRAGAGPPRSPRSWPGRSRWSGGPIGRRRLGRQRRPRDRLCYPGRPMKADIHPEYVLAHVTLLVRQRVQTRSTKPELHVEICSACHPFYTGKQKLIDTGGRVERFQRRLEKAGGATPRRRRVAPHGRATHTAAGRPRGRDDARPVELGRRRPHARRRDRGGRAATITSPMQRHRIWRLPVIRGVIALGESLAIGFRALAISANYAAQERGRGRRGPDRDLRAGRSSSRSSIAIGFALMLFKVGPALLTSWLPIDGTELVRDRRGPDPRRRLHRLHRARSRCSPTSGASSSTTAPSTRRSTRSRPARSSRPTNVQKFSLIHPRCGTAFLLWVMVIAHLRLRVRRAARLVLADRRAGSCCCR